MAEDRNSDDGPGKKAGKGLLSWMLVAAIVAILLVLLFGRLIGQ